ncbi:Zinc carboxypeptidase [Thermosyntropha lipolytica DSM 11003]|uniref:Zinc carboxypeptidase n=1 Tax=Thermosyntropha lipolytica DSM 11003 TaxID=1123382 RepID=A0A1M5QKQ9_9FIRM|nr:M14 family zinc carboxypeptidase [Thermosyntropha lipolytica]SHH14506.1 Zinc carboxypeptidase [Thermosyntropha lipolytica DSM 11003]
MKKLKFGLISLLVLILIAACPGYVYAYNMINPYQVYTYEQMVLDINKLKQEYGDLMEVEIIGQSEFGRDIYAIKIGNGLGTIFINASCHAREHIGTNLTMKMLEYYLYHLKNGTPFEGYDVNYLLSHNKIYFVPMVNPDGVTLVQKGLSAFTPEQQKVIRSVAGKLTDYRKWKANAMGIDLNRQYDVNFGNAVQNPGKPYPWNWPGKYPEQAREAKALADFARRIKPDITISYHASGNVIYYDQWIAPENVKRDITYARLMSRITGYPLAKIGYPTSGGFSPWIRKEFKTIAITPELGKHAGDYPVPVREFNNIWKANKTLGLASAAFNLSDLGVLANSSRRLIEEQERLKAIQDFIDEAAKFTGRLNYYNFVGKVTKEEDIEKIKEALEKLDELRSKPINMQNATAQQKSFIDYVKNTKYTVVVSNGEIKVLTVDNYLSELTDLADDKKVMTLYSGQNKLLLIQE